MVNFDKYWYKYRILSEDVAILLGTFSQNNKRFNRRTNGQQGHCISIIAYIYSTFLPMKKWNKYVMDQIIKYGDNLYIKNLKDYQKNVVKFHQINRTIYLNRTKYNMKINKVIMGKLIDFEKFLQVFCNENNCGIIKMKPYFYAFWRDDEDYYYLFDPTEHDCEGERRLRTPNIGYSCLYRIDSWKQITDILLKYHKDNKQTFSIYTCAIDRIEIMDMTAPAHVKDIVPVRPERCTVIELTEEEKQKLENLDDPNHKDHEATDGGEEVDQMNKPLPKSIVNLDEPRETGGVLPADRNPKNLDHSRDLALGAFVMLREKKSKFWSTSTVNQVIKISERWYRDPGSLPKVNNTVYKPVTIDYYSVGKLQSNQEEILDLAPVLTRFFIDNDGCLIVGPLLVGVWLEEGIYYIFDPNGRVYENKVSLSWYNSIEELFKGYLEAVEPKNKRTQFFITKVTVEDFIDIGEAWNYFEAISKTKWILHGNFSQSSRRFTKDTRNKQDVTNAIMTLIYLDLNPIETWSTDSIDQILQYGNEYYSNFMEDKDNNYDKLTIDDVPRNFLFIDYDIILDIEGLIEGEVGGKNLYEGIKTFFQNNKFGIITTHGVNLALWQNEDYFYFDPYSTNNYGFACDFGRACCICFLNVEELCNLLETNLPPHQSNFFKIYRVDIKITQLTSMGLVKPSLHYFDELEDNLAILRGNTSEKDPKFGENVEKQSVPMVIIGLAFSRLVPTILWDKETINKILDFGDQLYCDSLVLLDGELDAKVDEDIGGEGEDTPSYIDINDERITPLNVKKDFKIGHNEFVATIEQFFEGIVDEGFEENLQTNPVLVEYPNMTVTIWKDGKLYYLFDSKPRDAKGCGDLFIWPVPEAEGEDKPVEVEVYKGEGEGEGRGEMEAVPSEIVEEIIEDEGKACVLRFLIFADLVNHLTKHMGTDIIRMYNIKIDNKPIGFYLGNDWCNFIQFGEKQWILRGTKNLNDKFFMEGNRGKQAIPISFTALSYANLYSLTKYSRSTVDDILAYGDRLYTYSKNEKNTDNLLILDYVQKFCIGDSFIKVTLILNVIIGDVKMKTYFESALEQFFQSYHNGILTSKNQIVSIWENEGSYYMYDPQSRGPNGRKSLYGVACITRFQNFQDFSQIFQDNLEGDGSNFFYIHAVEIDKNKCPLIPIYKKPLGGFVEIDNNRFILKGTRLERNLSACTCIAVVALAMAMIQDTETWTKYTINQIIKIGENLYYDSAEIIGIDYVEIYGVKQDFFIKTSRVNFDVKELEEGGSITKKRQLRRAIERFFINFKRGVLTIEELSFSFWSVNLNVTIYYCFDPKNQCVFKFSTISYIAEYVFGMLPLGDEFSFSIIPLDFVIGKDKYGKKRKPNKNILQNGWHLISKNHQVLKGNVQQPNRDITSNIAAYITSKLIPFENWRRSHINLLVDIGNQLYIDSSLAYYPDNPKLGLENILRKFYVNEIQINLTIYKPLEYDELTKENLETNLINIFKSEDFCMVTFKDKWFSFFNFKDNPEFYYQFCPYHSKLDRYNILTLLIEEFVDSFCCEPIENYSIILISLDF